MVQLLTPPPPAPPPPPQFTKVDADLVIMQVHKVDLA